jgi:hypothetical protein
MAMVTQQQLLIGTRIADFKVSPTRVAVGETVTIAGTLQWHLWPICIWYGLEGKTVEIIADTAKIGETNSGSGGGFRFTWTPTSAGTYWVKAHFPGDIIYNGCDSQTVKVEVITPEQKRQEEMQFWALVGVGVAGALGVVGMVLYHFEEQRRMEMILARRRA